MLYTPFLLKDVELWKRGQTNRACQIIMNALTSSFVFISKAVMGFVTSGKLWYMLRSVLEEGLKYLALYLALQIPTAIGKQIHARIDRMFLHYFFMVLHLHSTSLS